MRRTNTLVSLLTWCALINLTEQLEAERDRRRAAEAEAKATAQVAREAEQRGAAPRYQPIIMGSTVYMMMPVEGVDPTAMRTFVATQAGGEHLLNASIEALFADSYSVCAKSS